MVRIHYNEDRTKIRHAENHPHGELRIKNWSVDGYCKETNTVYEYLGCYHHGHCKFHDAIKWMETTERIQSLKDLGYNVLTATSYEWEKEAVEFEVNHAVPVCTVKDIIEDAIVSEESFGIVKCDIHVPKHLISHFSEFPPIFKNTEITM